MMDVGIYVTDYFNRIGHDADAAGGASFATGVIIAIIIFYYQAGRTMMAAGAAFLLLFFHLDGFTGFGYDGRNKVTFIWIRGAREIIP